MQHQQDMFEAEAARTLLDQLFEESKLYHKSKDYMDLLDFVVKLRNFAPFNAMLLQVQKPGLSYAASAFEWREKFNRYPKLDARPLLILWPFAPVALVYDVLDTEGDPLPEDVSFVPAKGDTTKDDIQHYLGLLKRNGIKHHFFDGGDNSAGSIEVTKNPVPKDVDKKKKAKPGEYLMRMNQNHSPVVQFSTLAHELGHLYLGHLGGDEARSIPERPPRNHAHKELEAESFAYLLCQRNGVECKSKTYLANYVKANDTIEILDVYQILKAVGHVEHLLKLNGHIRFGSASDRASK